MTFDEYQKESRKTALYPAAGSNMIYPILGLTSEAGEVASKFKKILRDKKGVMGEEEKEGILQELGDVLWYLSQIASELNTPLASIADMNIKKLTSRAERGVLSGSGDSR